MNYDDSFVLVVSKNIKICLSVVQVFVNFAKQQAREDEDTTLHRRIGGGRKDVKISPVKRKT